ncbi:NHLP bacteriocin export ABC transporter permease/ATPase subunit [Sabulicella glaciei]|uniref:NHLP bacteriocin export ABC transporter permease/ATPase subunit n=1 Tax=Sabulicella glaciei TaxID=2984948 RepID=A0ABT3NTQ1_9PROT|nr:NHLP bacteriocin export ABC transporter permease/ATPase subunit [Roseococcus sp. MDT2-1-1]MCW8085545.1 NHLP bacteriocin export ABC transporter permease/ATPase subunit [Roseococcus sp. MDT2-1-1]
MSGIAPEASLHPASANPFVPTGPLVMDGGGLWFVVEAGALELRLSPSSHAGLSVPLLRVAAGSVAPCLGNAEHPVRAWPEPGTRLRPVAPEDVQAALLPALEAWLIALSRGAFHGPSPEPALPAEGEALSEATLLRPREGVVWALVEAGRLEEADGVVPGAGPGEIVPLPAAGPGLLGLPGTRLRYLGWASLLDKGQLPAALERFHAACLARLAAASQRAQESLSGRIAERASSGDARAAEAIASLAGKGGKTHDESEGEGLQGALRRIAHALGVQTAGEGVASSAGHTEDRHRAVLAAAEGFRLRARRVRLEPGWQHRAEEPFLGFLAPDGHPVALLPGTSKPVEADLEPFGYSFSPMLPDTKLGAQALLRLGLLGGRRELTTILLVSLLAGLLGLATPYATGLLFESIIPASARGELAQILAGLAAAAVGASVFALVRGFALLRLATTVNARLEAAIWDRLLRLPVSFFRGQQAADLAMRADAVNQMREAASGTVVGTALAALFGALNFVLLLHYSWRLALVALGLALVQALVMVAAALLQLRLRRRLLAASGRVRSFALELVEGIAKLRVAAAEDRGFARFALAFVEEARLSLRSRLVSGGVSAFGALWGTLSTGVLIAAVGLGWAQVGIGDFVAFSAAFGQFNSALLSLAGVMPSVLALVPLYERARPILEAVPEDAGLRRDPGTLRGMVELQGITFRYAPSLPSALDQVTLRAAPGETVALVGPSGSGKSTVLRLLLGFEAPEAGAVFMDGRDLAGLDPRAVRRQMGVVLQRGRVLAGSLLENIAGGVPMSVEEAMAAARAAGLEPDIAAMPMGLHTMLAEGGGTLSGGQRQRLMIARALAHRPRILLLDEATSALDNRTQEVVTRNLEAMGVTTLVVAHRLSTVQRAARIYVMDGGRVVEEGRFEELIEAGGLFARLAVRQLA